MAKQLRIELSLKDKIFNLTKKKRKDLISELRSKLIWVNHERGQWNEKQNFRLWAFIKENPTTANSWIREILAKN